MDKMNRSKTATLSLKLLSFLIFVGLTFIISYYYVSSFPKGQHTAGNYLAIIGIAIIVRLGMWLTTKAVMPRISDIVEAFSDYTGRGWPFF